MKANELMIGDWVAFQGRPYQYTAEDLATMAECEKNGVPTDTSEIPLAKEILEQNGFERNGTNFIIADDYYDVIIFELTDSIWTVVYHDCEMSFPDQRMHIAFVHELQHFLRACGIDKEIIIK